MVATRGWAAESGSSGGKEGGHGVMGLGLGRRSIRCCDGEERRDDKGGEER